MPKLLASAPIRNGASALTARPVLYVSPCANPRIEDGKISASRLPKTLKYPWPDESEDGAEDQERGGIAQVSVHGDEDRGPEDEAEEGGPAAEAVGDPSEARVSEERADLHRDHPSGGLHDAEAGAALARRARRGTPGSR